MKNIKTNDNINLTNLILIKILKWFIHKKSRNIINGKIIFRDTSFTRGLLETERNIVNKRNLVI
jgi:hypothetical protein